MVRGKPVRVGAAALAGSLAPGGRRRAGTVNPAGDSSTGWGGPAEVLRSLCAVNLGNLKGEEGLLQSTFAYVVQSSLILLTAIKILWAQRFCCGQAWFC